MSASQSPAAAPPPLSHLPHLLVIFIHGFRGEGEGTFESFPDRIRSVLTNTLSRLVDVDCRVYPKYETRGQMAIVVEELSRWLNDVVDEIREADRSVLGDGYEKMPGVAVVLCGHSMGGLVAADTILKYHDARHDKADTKADGLDMIGLLAFDTPYFGLHPSLLHRTASRHYITASQVASTASLLLPSASAVTVARSTGMSAMSRWSLAGAAIAAVSALGTAAYVHRDKIMDGVEWARGHSEFVSTLYREDEARERMRRIVETTGIVRVFRCYYTLIQDPPRTFIQLPLDESYRDYFVPAPSGATDEIAAHTSMFSSAADSSYYGLGRWTVSEIGKATRSWLRDTGLPSVTVIDLEGDDDAS